MNDVGIHCVRVGRHRASSAPLDDVMVGNGSGDATDGGRGNGERSPLALERSRCSRLAHSLFLGSRVDLWLQLLFDFGLDFRLDRRSLCQGGNTLRCNFGGGTLEDDSGREDGHFGLDFGQVGDAVGGFVSQVGSRRWHVEKRWDSTCRLVGRIGILVVFVVIGLLVAVVGAIVLVVSVYLQVVVFVVVMLILFVRGVVVAVVGIVFAVGKVVFGIRDILQGVRPVSTGIGLDLAK